MSERSDAQLHQRACELMARAAELEESQRAPFVERECSGDRELRDRVERLLRHHHEARSVLVPHLGSAPAAAAPRGAATATPDAQVGPFRIVRELGSGSMGVVYEAEQSLPRRRVALKLFRGGWREFVGWSCFEREIAALGRLRHPGIAALYEAGVAQTPHGVQPWFAMELVPGERLDEYVRRHSLDRRRRLQLLVQVCDAMEEAHRQGVVHRDLKPANLLVEPGDRARVVDFGVAHVADVAAETTATTIGELLGTLAYMSPEQVLGRSRQVDARTDVYALGVLLHELLTGRLPFDTSDFATAVRAITTLEAPPLSLFDPTLAGDLENVVAKALEKEPARRYATAAALADDLRRHLDGRSVLARPPSLRSRAAKFARRHRVLIVAGSTTSLAVVGGLVALAVGWSKASNALATSEARRRAAIELVLADVRDVKEMGDFSGAALVRQQTLERTARFVQEQRLPEAADAGDVSATEALASFRDAECDLLVRDTRLDEAKPKAGESLELWRWLTAQRPDRVDWRAALSAAQVKAGDLADDRGDVAAARSRYLDALRVDESLVERCPDDTRMRENLAHSCSRLAELEAKLHHVVAADEFERRWLAISEELVRRDASSRSAKLSLVRAHVARFERISAGSGALAAVEHADEAVRIVEPLATESRGDVELTRAWLAALRASMVVAAERKELKSAVKIGEHRVKLARRLVDENPNRRDLFDERYVVACDLAVLWARRRDTGELWHLCGVVVPSIDADPNTTRLARQIAAELDLLWGRSERQAGCEGGGLDHFQQALQRLDGLDCEQRNDRRVVRALVVALLDPNFTECDDGGRAVRLVDDYFTAFPEEPALWALGAAGGAASSLDSVAVEIACVVDRRCTHLGECERAAIAELRHRIPASAPDSH